MKHNFKNTWTLILGLIVTGAFGQEYDDLYFRNKDRVKEKKQEEVATSSSYDHNSDQNLSFLGRQYQHNSEPILKSESEEPSDYYKPEKTQENYRVEKKYPKVNRDYYSTDAGNNNSNFNDPVSTYQNEIPPQVIINNYSTNGGNNWNRQRGGFGWNNWGGASYGNVWGNPWGNPWAFNVGYNSFWNSGWNLWGLGIGFNNPFGYPSVWGGRGFYGRPVYAVYEGDRGRNVVRGARPSRGSTSVRESRLSSGRRSVAVENSSGKYSRQQADYLNRSRSNNRYGRSSFRGSGSVNGRTINDASGNTGRSHSSISNRSGRSESNRSYSRPSNNSGNRSYSSPSNSSRNNRSLSPAKSSSRSRSSSSLSKSGRSSSGSRSSSSRSSRSSSGRRGN